MSRHSPGPKAYQLSNYKADNTKRIEKSSSKVDGINHNLSSPIINPYIEQLNEKITEKKRNNYNIAYQAPVLLQQNKQLLAENQEMAILIHEKNIMIETLQKNYNDKVQKEVIMLKQVEAQKQRFICQILRHKQQTDRTIIQLQEELNKERDQKNQMQKMWNRERINQRDLKQKERINQIQKLVAKYQDNISIIQSDKMKLKTQLDRINNENKMLQGQYRQKISKLQNDLERSKDQIKHAQHVRKLQVSELKQHYENKQQKMHLQFRRHKQIFLIEHQNQIKRLHQQIEKFKKQIQVLEDNIQKKDEKIKNCVKNQQLQNEKQKGKMQENIIQVKEKCNKEKKILYDVFDTQHQLTKTANNQQVIAMKKQNERLFQCLKFKEKEQTRLYNQIDFIRQQYCTDLEQYQQTVTELLSKLYSNEIGNQEQKELLKTRLAVLRQSDLKGFKNYYQNQLKVMNDKLVEKDQIILEAKNKLHEQLRNKSEARKQYQIQFIQYKSKITELNRKIHDLQVEIVIGDKQKIEGKQKQAYIDQKANKIVEKADQNRKGQLSHLQAIIQAKDKEMEQLDSKIKLLSINHTQQLRQKTVQIEQLKQNRQYSLAEKNKIIQRLQSEIAKYKQLLKKQKEEFEKDIIFMNDQRKKQIDTVNQELVYTKDLYENHVKELKSQIKNLRLQISKLKIDIEDRQNEKNILTNDIQINHKLQADKQKEMLEQFYKQQLKFRDDQILDLKKINSQLLNDVTDARENYSNLQKKFQNLIQSQSALRQIEQKVLNIGKSNNLVKNLTQVAK